MCSDHFRLDKDTFPPQHILHWNSDGKFILCCGLLRKMYKRSADVSLAYVINAIVLVLSKTFTRAYSRLKHSCFHTAEDRFLTVFAVLLPVHPECRAAVELRQL